MKSMKLSNVIHHRHYMWTDKKEGKNRAETTSLSSAFTSLPSHVTEVISSLGWARAWILYFRIRTEQFLKRKFILFLNKLFLAGKARSSPVISTETSFEVSQLSNAQVYGEIWLGSSENNGFVVIQKSKRTQISALMFSISFLTSLCKSIRPHNIT